MKSLLLSILSVIIISVSGISQETKVYIKGDGELGKFYVYVDSILMNRSPQVQVGILGLDKKSSYAVRVVFQDSSRMPITGNIKPKKDRIRLYVLYSGTGKQVKARKASGITDTPIPGDTPASHPALPNYKGRLGCDYPIGDEVITQVVSQMTSILPRTPLEIGTEAVTTNCLTTSQLRELLEALETDSDREQLCKVAWFYLYDQENFEEKLSDVFTEPGKVQQVLNFVKKNQ